MTGVIKLCQCCFKPIKDQEYVDMRVKVGDPSGLLQNNSRRARRLLDLAAKGQLDLSQLLAIV